VHFSATISGYGNAKLLKLFKISQRYSENRMAQFYGPECIFHTSGVVEGDDVPRYIFFPRNAVVTNDIRTRGNGDTARNLVS